MSDSRTILDEITEALERGTPELWNLLYNNAPALVAVAQAAAQVVKDAGAGFPPEKGGPRVLKQSLRDLDPRILGEGKEKTSICEPKAEAEELERKESR